ncbi:MAG: hypothetical protein Q4A27_03075 [bacterium]|nr:hypothetical protein [bacterium]
MADKHKKRIMGRIADFVIDYLLGIIFACYTVIFVIIIFNLTSEQSTLVKNVVTNGSPLIINEARLSDYIRELDDLGVKYEVIRKDSEIFIEKENIFKVGGYNEFLGIRIPQSNQASEITDILNEAKLKYKLKKLPQKDGKDEYGYTTIEVLYP